MKYLKVTLISIFFLPSLIYAASDMTMSSSPSLPAPYQSVTLTLISYSFDVNTANIVWTVSGRTFTGGVGVKQITVQTMGIGESIPVKAQAALGTGEIVEANINLTPQGVDILWETPESYTPPFYLGKSLPGVGSTVRATALPNLSSNGLQIPAQNISYSWYVNDDFLSNISGYGKQFANIPLDYLSSKTNIRVVARGPTGVASEKTISIYPHDVLPLLYIYDDSLGVKMEQSIFKRFETTRDFTLSLIPFYLSVKNNFSTSGNYTWLLEGLPVTPEEKTILSFHPEENASGLKKLSVSLSNSRRTLQKAETDLEILFDTRK